MKILLPAYFRVSVEGEEAESVGLSNLPIEAPVCTATGKLLRF